MTKILRLVRVVFDNLENNVLSARSAESLGLFEDSPGVTAYAKIEAVLYGRPPEKHYIGHDMQIYPQYRIEENVAQ